MIFYPDYQKKRVYELTPSFLKKIGVQALILDIDNTLTTHDHPVPSDGVAIWLDEMRQAGVGMIVLSNNSAERVKPFADILKLSYISDGGKPLTAGYKRAQKALGVKKEQIAMVGDQLLTDILGGNLYGCKTILVEPIELEPMKFFKFKRKIERLLLKRYRPQNDQ